MTRPVRGVAARAPYPRLMVDNPPLPAWVPERAPLRDDGNPARGIANAVLIGAAMWGIGLTIWWALDLFQLTLGGVLGVWSLSRAQRWWGE